MLRDSEMWPTDLDWNSTPPGGRCGRTTTDDQALTSLAAENRQQGRPQAILFGDVFHQRPKPGTTRYWWGPNSGGWYDFGYLVWRRVLVSLAVGRAIRRGLSGCAAQQVSRNFWAECQQDLEV